LVQRASCPELGSFCTLVFPPTTDYRPLPFGFVLGNRFSN
jgi:hypothetical protein